MMTTDKEKLKSIIEEGILTDIYRFEEAFYLIKIIGNNIDDITRQGYEKLFNAIYDSLILQLITRLSKIFEKSKRYQVQSIPFVIDFIELHKAELDIYNREGYISSLQKLGMNTDGLIELHYKEFNSKCVEHFRKILPEPKRDSLNILEISLHNTKWQRDKGFLHNEILDDKNKFAPTFGGMLNLIDFAKFFLIALGWGYTGTIYGHDFDWSLKDDTELSGLQMEELLKIS